MGKRNAKEELNEETVFLFSLATRTTSPPATLKVKLTLCSQFWLILTPFSVFRKDGLYERSMSMNDRHLSGQYDANIYLYDSNTRAYSECLAW